MSFLGNYTWCKEKAAAPEGTAAYRSLTVAARYQDLQIGIKSEQILDSELDDSGIHAGGGDLAERWSQLS